MESFKDFCRRIERERSEETKLMLRIKIEDSNIHTTQPTSNPTKSADRSE